MEYIKIEWNELREEPFNDWGTSTFYLEIDEEGFPSRQIEEYENGAVLKYDEQKTHDSLGMLGDQKIESYEINKLQISKADFEERWRVKIKSFVISKSIGVLFQDDRVEDFWESSPRRIPFFDNKTIKISFLNLEPANDKLFINEADTALNNFLSMGPSNRLKLSSFAYQNCMEFLNAVEYDEEDKPLWDIKDQSEIWNFVYPQDIEVIRRYRRDQDIYINVICECEWEREHGLQLVFRQGKKLTRISSQDGHITEADANDIPDDEDQLLSQFKSLKKESVTTSKNNFKKNAKMGKKVNSKKLSLWKRLWSKL